MKRLRLGIGGLLLAALGTIPASGQTIGKHGFEFAIPWSGDTPVVVEASTNLAVPVWVQVITNSPSGGTFSFSDPQWTNYYRRFYRSISLDRSVRSSNAVGFAKVWISRGYNLLANPLSTGLTNGANEIMPVLEGAQFLTWNGTGFDTVAYNTLFGGWIDVSNLTPASPPALPPGRGFFYYNPSSTNSTHVFVGAVVPALCTTNYLPLPIGYSLISSPLPADVEDIAVAPVSLPLILDMQFHEWNGAGYDAALYSSLFSSWWWPGCCLSPCGPPQYRVGKAFFFYNPGPVTHWAQYLGCP